MHKDIKPRDAINLMFSCVLSQYSRIFFQLETLHQVVSH